MILTIISASSFSRARAPSERNAPGRRPPVQRRRRGIQAVRAFPTEAVPRLLADLVANGGDPGHDLGAQRQRRLLALARPLDHRLDDLVEVVLLQARRALVEVLADLVRVRGRHLAVE